MSFSIFVQKFKLGKPAAINFEKFSALIADFGTIENTKYGLELFSNVGEMFETASLSVIDEGGISGISFHRPTDSSKLQELIFQILQFEGTCFFDQDLDFLQYRNLDAKDLPPMLIEKAPLGLIPVHEPKEIWDCE